MDNVSNEKITWIIGGLDLNVWSMPPHILKLFTELLLELKQRRAENREAERCKTS